MKAVKNNRGFTLIEMLVATALFGVIVAASGAAFRYAAQHCTAGGFQVQFTTQARVASQKISRYIEQGKAIGLASNGIDIIQRDLTYSRIKFVDRDSDLSTVTNNYLIYVPDVTVSNDEQIICSYVSPLRGEPMFSILSSSPNAARLRFHVGDSTNLLKATSSGTGKGYQGIEVRISASPRNVQRWYE